MHITFIQPAVGHKSDGSCYPKSWVMEPLAIAMLSALTPPEWERRFFDDRLREIDYEAPTDLVCISSECYSAKRSYQIAARYRKRGVTVAIGGFHATLAPEEVREHADILLIGEAENYWKSFLDDFARGNAATEYSSTEAAQLAGRFADRSIFGKRSYGPLALVESARGCRFQCEFCSITRFFRQQYTERPITEVAEEIRGLKKRLIFFVDDNLAMDVERLKALCRALIPLRIHWLGQLSIHAAKDTELLELMRASGCAGVLIGFESLTTATLEQMGKQVNRENDFEEAIEHLRQYGISIYATFVFGYDGDTEESFVRTLAFARKHRFFFAAFNHLVPFPGTGVYERLQREGRLHSEHWWLDEDITFGDVVFEPKNFSAARLAQLCQEYRRRFYAPESIFYRGTDWRANCRGILKTLLYYYNNFSQGREVRRRRHLPCGDPE